MGLLLVVIPIVIMIYLLLNKNNSTQNIVDSKIDPVTTDKPVATDKPVTTKYDIHKKIIFLFSDMIDDIIHTDKLIITNNMVYAVIHSESGNFLHLPNKDILASDKKSWGYMQVTPIALKDVNIYFKENTLYQSVIDNEYINLRAGCMYLHICYKSALLASNNPVKLAFKKYNGGNDESDKSINSMADKYADKTYSVYLLYQSNIF